VKLTYDKKTNVGYLQIKKSRIAKTVKFQQKLLIDMNTKGEIVGIELLDLDHPPKPKRRPASRVASARTSRSKGKSAA